MTATLPGNPRTESRPDLLRDLGRHELVNGLLTLAASLLHRHPLCFFWTICGTVVRLSAYHLRVVLRTT
jgi:predicted benzoate:H+ symporter BenE